MDERGEHRVPGIRKLAHTSPRKQTKGPEWGGFWEEQILARRSSLAETEGWGVERQSTQVIHKSHSRTALGKPSLTDLMSLQPPCAKTGTTIPLSQV